MNKFLGLFAVLALLFAPAGAVEIKQGQERAADIQARKTAWENRDKDAEKLARPLDMEAVERLLRGLGVTQGQINQAKRDRGKPMP